MKESPNQESDQVKWRPPWGSEGGTFTPPKGWKPPVRKQEVPTDKVLDFGPAWR